MVCLSGRNTLLGLLVEVGVAELGDDVGVVLGGVDLMQVEDVGSALQLLQDLDFGLEQSSVDFVFEHLQVDYLDCDWLVYMLAHLLLLSLRPLNTWLE